MKIDRQLLNSAVQEGIISEDQAEKLWQYFKKQLENVASFNLTHLLYYFGGFIAISAMSLFITLGWELLGGFGIMVTSLLYMLIGILVTNYLFRRQLVIPAGIIATLVIALTPLAIYGLQKMLGYWPDQYNYQSYHRIIDKLWLIMELGTLLVGAIIFYFYRRPFLLFPIAFTLWYMSMDIASFIFQDKLNPASYWDNRKWVSLIFGLIMLIIAFIIDIKNRTREDYAFHLYLFGMLAFWGGLTSFSSDSEVGKFLYCCINILLIFIGALLARRVFTVFGAIGVFLYLGHLAFDLFKNSILFPFALSLFGFLIIYLGVLWHRHGNSLETRIRAHLPPALKNLSERR